MLIAATLRTFRLPTSLCAVSKVHTGPLQDLRVLETIFLVVLFEKYVLRLLFVAKIPPSPMTPLFECASPRRQPQSFSRRGPATNQRRLLSRQGTTAGTVRVCLSYVFRFQQYPIYILFFELYFKINSWRVLRQCCVECHACISRNGRRATHTETSVCSQAAPKRVWLRCWRCSNPSIPLQLFWATVR